MKIVSIGTYSDDSIYGMTNLNPNKSNLPAIIWVDHAGVQRKVSHKDTPRAKITVDDLAVSVSLEPDPKIVEPREASIRKSDLRKIGKALEYIGRNYDLLLRHYNDVNFSFDDEDLKEALRNRGEYR